MESTKEVSKFRPQSNAKETLRIPCYETLLSMESWLIFELEGLKSYRDKAKEALEVYHDSFISAQIAKINGRIKFLQNLLNTVETLKDYQGRTIPEI